MVRSKLNDARVPSVIIFLFIAMSFVYVFSVFLISKGGYSFILSIVVALYFTFLISQLVFYRKFSIFHPLLIYILWREFVSGFVGDYMLLFSANEIKTAVGVFYNHEAHEIIMKLFSLKIISLLAFIIGFYSIKRLYVSRPVIEVNEVKNLSFKLLLLLMALFLLVFYLSIMVGGIGNLLNQRSIVYYERISFLVGGHYHAFVRAIPIFMVLIACVNINYIKKPIFVFSLIFSYFSVFIVTGNRSVIITSIIMIVLVYIIEKNKIQWKILFSIGVIIIIMFGVLGGIRSSNNEDGSSLSESVAFTYNEMKERAVYVNGVVPILAKVPENVEWLYGKSYLSIPFIFVPSAALSFEKPAAGGRLTTQLIYQRDDTGIPPTPLGEAYWNFGFLGVFVIYFLLGLVIKILYNNFKASPGSPVNKFIYVYSILSLSLASDNLFNLFQFLIISLVLYAFFVFDLNKLLRHDI